VHEALARDTGGKVVPIRKRNRAAR
jgi:hypothetical protein